MNSSSSTAPNHLKPQDINNFWFEEIDESMWFKKDSSFDATVKRRFEATRQQAAKGELAHWRVTAEGRLAEIIVLDQFSRNIFRDSAQAFESDVVALVIAQEGIALQQDKELPAHKKRFFYMPFMHSESASIHEMAVELFSQPGLEENLAFEKRHKAIIDRFGRYPHRNEIIGRKSSEVEVEFLGQPGSSF